MSDFPTEEFKEYRKQVRARKRSGVYTALVKNGIDYRESNIQGVVTIGDDLHLSTQPKNGKYRFRFAGSATWYELPAPVFFANLKAGKYDSNTIGFGKYKGSTLDEVFVGDRKYVEWMVTLDNLKPSMKKKALALLGPRVY